MSHQPLSLLSYGDVAPSVARPPTWRGELVSMLHYMLDHRVSDLPLPPWLPFIPHNDPFTPTFHQLFSTIGQTIHEHQLRAEALLLTQHQWAIEKEESRLGSLQQMYVWMEQETERRERTERAELQEAQLRREAAIAREAAAKLNVVPPVRPAPAAPLPLSSFALSTLPVDPLPTATSLPPPKPAKALKKVAPTRKTVKKPVPPILPESSSEAIVSSSATVSGSSSPSGSDDGERDDFSYDSSDSLDLDSDTDDGGGSKMEKMRRREKIGAGMTTKKAPHHTPSQQHKTFTGLGSQSAAAAAQTPSIAVAQPAPIAAPVAEPLKPLPFAAPIAERAPATFPPPPLDVSGSPAATTAPSPTNASKSIFQQQVSPIASPSNREAILTVKLSSPTPSPELESKDASEAQADVTPAVSAALAAHFLSPATLSSRPSPSASGTSTPGSRPRKTKMVKKVKASPLGSPATAALMSLPSAVTPAKTPASQLKFKTPRRSPASIKKEQSLLKAKQHRSEEVRELAAREREINSNPEEVRIRKMLLEKLLKQNEAMSPPIRLEKSFFDELTSKARSMKSVEPSEELRGLLYKELDQADEDWIPLTSSSEDSDSDHEVRMPEPSPLASTQEQEREESEYEEVTDHEDDIQFSVMESPISSQFGFALTQNHGGPLTSPGTNPLSPPLSGQVSTRSSFSLVNAHPQMIQAMQGAFAAAMVGSPPGSSRNSAGSTNSTPSPQNNSPLNDQSPALPASTHSVSIPRVSFTRTDMSRIREESTSSNF